MKLKLQKYMANAGIASRRKSEEFIKDGYVKVNNETAHIGQIIDTDVDTISYNDEIVKITNELVYYKFNKPRGIVTTCADNDDRNIIDIIDVKERVFPIGRLDKNTDGLIILTNDGRLSNKLMHPSFEHEKEYIVKIYGTILDSKLDILREGVYILGSRTKKCEVERISSGTFRIKLKEGKNRQIRRMLEKVGHEVKYLRRVSVENITLGNLQSGELIPFSKKEKEVLLSKCGLI